MNMIDLLFQRQNLTEQRNVPSVRFDCSALEICEDLIRNAQYLNIYDMSGNGELDSTDYNTLYNMFYGKFDDYKKSDSSETSLDIRDIARMKKNIAGLNNIEHNNLDFDDDSETTGNDIEILKRWLLYGKTERASFT